MIVLLLEHILNIDFFLILNKFDLTFEYDRYLFYIYEEEIFNICVFYQQDFCRWDLYIYNVFTKNCFLYSLTWYDLFFDKDQLYLLLFENKQEANFWTFSFLLACIFHLTVFTYFWMGELGL